MVCSQWLTLTLYLGLSKLLYPIMNKKNVWWSILKDFLWLMNVVLVDELDAKLLWENCSCDRSHFIHNLLVRYHVIVYKPLHLTWRSFLMSWRDLKTWRFWLSGLPSLTFITLGRPSTRSMAMLWLHWKLVGCKMLMTFDPSSRWGNLNNRFRGNSICVSK